MGFSTWFTPPDVVRVPLEFRGEKFWVEFKRELNVGEAKRLATAGFRAMASGGTTGPAGTGAAAQAPEPEIRIDWTAQGFARVEIYLAAWSLQHDDGSLVKLTRDAVHGLRPELFEVISAALDKHIEEQDQKKAPRSGDSAPSPTSL